MRRMLRAGADKVSLNTAAVERTRHRASRRGRVRHAMHRRRNRRAPRREGAVGGRDARRAYARPVSKRSRGPTQVCELGAGEILLTSMDRDGTKAGYDIELLQAMNATVDVPVIASGGVGTLEHLYEGVASGGASAVLAASIFHFGQHTVREAKQYLAERGVTVRP